MARPARLARSPRRPRRRRRSCSGLSAGWSCPPTYDAPSLRPHPPEGFSVTSVGGRSLNPPEAQMDRFSDKAATWDEEPGNVERAHAIADEIRRAVPLRPDMRVLEIGGGTGLLS